METTVFEIELTDSRVYRVFCANRKQKLRFMYSLDKIDYKELTKVTNGVHTIKQWEKQIEHFQFETKGITS